MARTPNKDFFRTLIAGVDDDTTMASDGKASSEFSGYIDTGSYSLNALLSGDLFGGAPNNKVTVFAGESSTGKTFFIIGIIKQWLDANPTGGVIYFDTESAVTNHMLTERGVDISRVIKSEPDSIEKFKHVAANILDRYMEQEEADRRPLLMVLDSLGMLSSKKEIGDTLEGKDVKDMTKPGLIRAVFRVLRLKLARAKVAMLVTNHTYEVVGAYVPTKKMSGGQGAIYASDTIAFLSKKKDKDEATKEVIGSIVTVKMEKSRLSREGSVGETRIAYNGGLDRYHGLFAWGEDAGLIVKEGQKYRFPDGRVAFRKFIEKNEPQFFTKDFLDALNEQYVAKKFKYIAAAAPEDLDEELDEGNDQ